MKIASKRITALVLVSIIVCQASSDASYLQPYCRVAVTVSPPFFESQALAMPQITNHQRFYLGILAEDVVKLEEIERTAEFPLERQEYDQLLTDFKYYHEGSAAEFGARLFQIDSLLAEMGYEDIDGRHRFTIKHQRDFGSAYEINTIRDWWKTVKGSKSSIPAAEWLRTIENHNPSELLLTELQHVDVREPFIELSQDELALLNSAELGQVTMHPNFRKFLMSAMGWRPIDNYGDLRNRLAQAERWPRNKRAAVITLNLRITRLRNAIAAYLESKGIKDLKSKVAAPGARVLILIIGVLIALGFHHPILAFTLASGGGLAMAWIDPPNDRANFTTLYLLLLQMRLAIANHSMETFRGFSEQFLNGLMAMAINGKGSDAGFSAIFVEAMEADFWAESDSFSIEAQTQMLLALRDRQKLRGPRWVKALQPAWQAMLGKDTIVFRPVLIEALRDVDRLEGVPESWFAGQIQKILAVDWLSENPAEINSAMDQVRSICRAIVNHRPENALWNDLREDLALNFSFDQADFSDPLSIVTAFMRNAQSDTSRTVLRRLHDYYQLRREFDRIPALGEFEPSTRQWVKKVATGDPTVTLRVSLGENGSWEIVAKNFSTPDENAPLVVRWNGKQFLLNEDFATRYIIEGEENPLASWTWVNNTIDLVLTRATWNQMRPGVEQIILPVTGTLQIRLKPAAPLDDSNVPVAGRAAAAHVVPLPPIDRRPAEETMSAITPVPPSEPPASLRAKILQLLISGDTHAVIALLESLTTDKLTLREILSETFELFDWSESHARNEAILQFKWNHPLEGGWLSQLETGRVVLSALPDGLGERAQIKWGELSDLFVLARPHEIARGREMSRVRQLMDHLVDPWSVFINWPERLYKDFRGNGYVQSSADDWIIDLKGRRPGPDQLLLHWISPKRSFVAVDSGVSHDPSGHFKPIPLKSQPLRDLLWDGQLLRIILSGEAIAALKRREILTDGREFYLTEQCSGV